MHQLFLWLIFGEQKTKFFRILRLLKRLCWLLLSISLPLLSTNCFHALSAILCCTCVMKLWKKCREQWTSRGGGECMAKHTWMHDMENGEKLLIEKLIRSFTDYTWLVMPQETMRRKGIYISCETVCSVRQCKKTSHRRRFIQTMSLVMPAEIANGIESSFFLFWD